MGIPKLEHWLREQRIQFTGSPQPRNSPKGSKTRYEQDLYCEGLLIDTSDLLHYVAQRIYQYGEFEDTKPKIDPKTSDQELKVRYLQLLVSILESYLEQYQPRQYFIVAIDGPAPLAKIFQQRKRRFSRAGEMDTDRFSSMYLTPGTSFMHDIDVYLKEWFESYKGFPPYTIYSGHQIPGEGEHKMFKYLKESLKAGDVVEGNGLHIFTGQDGDLLMISSLVPLKNLIWVKEDRKKHLGQMIPDPRSIQKFRDRIAGIIGRDRLTDFVTMMFLHGNDFFPQHPAFGSSDISVETFTRSYIEMARPLIDSETGNINRTSLKIFFEFMAAKEQPLFLEIARTFRPKGEIQYPILMNNIPRDAQKRIINLDFPKFRRDWYIRVLKEYYPEKASDTLNIDSHLEDLIQKMTTSYINMLQWNIDYYRNESITISWNRVYPYSFAPLFYDLAKSNSPIQSSSDPVDDDSSDTVRIGGIESASIIRQLLMVIHPKMVPKIIPREYAKLIVDPDPNVAVLKKFSPDLPRIFTDNRDKEYLWYSVLPIVNSEDYDNAIESVKARRRDLPVYMNVKSQPFVRKVDVNSGEETIVKSLPKLKAEDSKYQWTSRMLM
jgi:5'-3' exonuclease